MEGLAQFFLAVGVHICGVKVVDAAVIGPADQFYRVGLGDTLDRQRAEGRFGDVQLCAAQPDLFHISFLLFFLRTGRKIFPR